MACEAGRRGRGHDSPARPRAESWAAHCAGVRRSMSMERTQSVAVAPPVSASPAPRLRCARVRAGRSRARAPCRDPITSATCHLGSAGRPAVCHAASGLRSSVCEPALSRPNRRYNDWSRTERNETDYVHVDRDGSRKRVLLISDNSALFGADALLVSLKFSSGFR